jgi:predicted membrane metal-binding protein
MAAAGHTIPELDRKGLREFGLVTGAIVAGLFGLFFPWLLERSWPLWPWAIFGLLAAWGLLAPLSLRPLYRVWMRFGLLLSKITTPIIMGLVFFVLITPMGLIRRLAGRDSMARGFDDSQTYRVASKKPAPDNLEKPY